jgi:hypothetical protein
MPLTHRAGVDRYKTRISEILLKEFNIKLYDDEIKFKSCQVSSFRDPVALIEGLKNIK